MTQPRARFRRFCWGHPDARVNSARIDEKIEPEIIGPEIRKEILSQKFQEFSPKVSQEKQPEVRP